MLIGLRACSSGKPRAWGGLRRGSAAPRHPPAGASGAVSRGASTSMASGAGAGTAWASAMATLDVCARGRGLWAAPGRPGCGSRATASAAPAIKGAGNRAVASLGAPRLDRRAQLAQPRSPLRCAARKPNDESGALARPVGAALRTHSPRLARPPLPCHRLARSLRPHPRSLFASAPADVMQVRDNAGADVGLFGAACLRGCVAAPQAMHPGHPARRLRPAAHQRRHVLAPCPTTAHLL